MTRSHLPNSHRFLWIFLALSFSASMCFRDPCEGKWSDASSFSIRGVEWVNGKVGVLGVFTKRQKCPNLLGYTYQTLYSRDVMFFVDPSTIHQDENGWWIVEADSAWIIHQEPSIEGGGYLRKDPKGRGWWVASDISTGKVLLYDSTFSHILLSIDGGGIAFFPSGDSILFGRDDTVRIYDLLTHQETPLFRGGGLIEVSPNGKIYIATSDYRLLRWEGADSFTVIDSPIVSFGLKGDTLAAEKGHAFYFWSGNNLVDSLPITGHVWSGIAGNCRSTWRWFGNMATTCREADAVFCVSVSPDTGGVLCTTEFSVHRSLLP